MEVGGRILRKRRRPSCDKEGPNGTSASVATSNDRGLSALLEAAKTWRRVVVVSGSGLSASSGMSTFSTPGGLYERAASAARLAKGGKQLFCWSFFERRRHDALAFLADVHAEAAAARPTRGHRALARLARAGALSRHFTLNIDGLSERAGMRTWRLEEDPEFNGEKEKEEKKEEEGEEEKAEEEEGAEEQRPRRSSSSRSRSRSRSASLPPLDPQRGVTVELHGNVHELVCPDCHRVTPMTETALAALRARVDLPCVGCPGGVVSSDDEDEDDGDKKKEKGAPVPPSSSSLAPPPFSEPEATGGPLRLRVMLYDDAQGDAITPDEVLDLLEADVAAADAVLWVGLSFEQSATTAYFRRVRAALQAVGRCPGQAEEGIGARDGRGARGRGRGGRGRGRGRGRERGGSRGGGSGGSAGEEAEEGCCSDSPSSPSASPSASPSRSCSPAKQQQRRHRRPKRPLPCLQAIVNPAADDAAFNLLSSCHNRDGIDVLEVRCSSDVALEELAKVLCRGREGVGGEEEEAGEGAAEEKAEVVKKEGAAATATATTTADVAADASTGFAAAAAPAPPPPHPSSSSSQLELEVARAREAIAAARAKAKSAAPAAEATAAADPTTAAAAAARAAGGESPPPASPRLSAVVVVPPVAAAFASAPPLSGEEGAAKNKEKEKEAAKAGAAAAEEEHPESASPAAAVGAAEARPAGRIRLTCTSEPGDDDSDDEDDGDDGGGVVKGAFFGSGGEH